MITCNLAGGLGNQLFQIFAIIAHSIKHNKQFQFLHTDSLGGENCLKRVTYWNTFLHSLTNFTVKTLPENLHVISHGGIEFREIPSPPMEYEHILYDGYFQSYKYFDGMQDKICRLIRLEQSKQECLDKYQMETRVTNTKCISMHFRLGDYKHLGHFHPIMSFEYYRNALTHILTELSSESLYKILYFCEAEDNDIVSGTIQRLSGVFPQCIFEKASDEMSDWEQLLIMSCCEHNIIANSSFSWFAAYFNNYSNKIICYPEMWFCGYGKDIYVGDMFPPSWKKVSCS